MRYSVKAGVTLTSAAALLLAGCSGSDAPDSATNGDVTIDYWLWDDAQVSGYQQCAAAFTEENPGIQVKISQYAWDDYWTKITASFVGGAGPDVFAMQLAQIGAFIDQKQIVPLDDYLAADPVDFAQYREGLVEAWVDTEGNRYGLPKDWDVTTLFFNSEMLEDAGIDPTDTQELTWNPEDGGTFEEVIAHLTVDKNGVRGDEEGFDKNNIAVYGLGVNADYNLHGQTSWADFALSTGWTYLDKNPWGTQIGYSDKGFQDAVEWYYGLSEKGYMPASNEFSTGQTDQFGSQKVATILEGTWNANTIYNYDGIEPLMAAAPTHTGTGERATLYNSLSDSISAASDNKDEAWKWVRFMASADCQDLVAEEAVIFPSIESSSNLAREAFDSKGIDVSAVEKYFEDNGVRVTMPVVRNSAKATSTAALAFENIHLGKQGVSDLTALADEVNSIIAE
jgi:multiple sugar transport system substrate-binding protein